VGGVPDHVLEAARAVTTVLRIVPIDVLVGARRPHRMVERSIMFYRHAWMILVSGFFEPLLYLLSVQVGFAALVGDVVVGGVAYDYAQFVAPALLAASAMNGAIFDATGNVFEKLRHTKLYDTVLATPMTAADVAVGEILSSVGRAVIYSTAFVVTMWALGLVGSVWIVLAIPVCALIGFAFAAVGMAYTTFMRTWSDLEYVNAVTLPLLLFSATFYPLSSYGDWGWLVQFSPLYHGVAVVRGLNLGHFEWAMLAHLGVLAVVALVGLGITSRRIEGLLLR
jgi:lipooligosaccharide transport system permease protein